MTNPNTVFFVGAKNVDNESLDLLVIAANKDDAKSIWQKYYDLDDDEVEPQFINPIPGVTPTREPGAITWNEINPD